MINLRQGMVRLINNVTGNTKMYEENNNRFTAFGGRSDVCDW